MYLKELLKDVSLIKVSNHTVKPLSNNEDKSIRIFINALLDEDNCQAIFRGEKVANAYEQSGIKISSDDNSNFAAHGKVIFFIGTKAKSYLYDNDDVVFPIDINYTHHSLFEGLYEEIESLIKDIPNEFDSDFKNYFSSKSKIDFTTAIISLHKDEKQSIKIYYLWLLHVIGKSKYKKYSNFLSTTKDHKVASFFGNDELVYCGWIPRPIKKKAAYLGSLMQMQRHIKSIGLPTYNDEPYHNEQEISLIGGLLPHFTLGIYRHPRLLVNTNLLEKKSLFLINHGMSEMIIKMGIAIDQTNFSESEEFKNSKYKRWLTYSEETGYSDQE
jgi:hypothetical protein